MLLCNIGGIVTIYIFGGKVIAVKFLHLRRWGKIWLYGWVGWLDGLLLFVGVPVVMCLCLMYCCSGFGCLLFVVCCSPLLLVCCVLLMLLFVVLRCHDCGCSCCCVFNVVVFCCCCRCALLLSLLCIVVVVVVFCCSCLLLSWYGNVCMK